MGKESWVNDGMGREAWIGMVGFAVAGSVFEREMRGIVGRRQRDRDGEYKMRVR